MRTKYSAIISLALGSLIVAGAGCQTATTTDTVDTNVVATDTTVTVDTTEVADVAADGASISIVSPVDGDTVESTADLTVAIEGFTLAPDKVEGANAEGEGHYHVWVDGEYLTPGVATTTTLTGLEAGEREIMVSLQNNDHTDLTTPVKSEAVTVTVE